MILADTSVWIEFFRGKPDYSSLMMGLIEEQKVRAIGCVFGSYFKVRGQKPKPKF